MNVKLRTIFAKVRLKLYSTSSQQKCFLRIPRPRHSGPSSASAFGSSRREIAIIYRFKVAMMCAGLAAGHCTVGVGRHRSRVDMAIWGNYFRIRGGKSFHAVYRV